MFTINLIQSIPFILKFSLSYQILIMYYFLLESLIYKISLSFFIAFIKTLKIVSCFLFT